MDRIEMDVTTDAAGVAHVPCGTANARVHVVVDTQAQTTTLVKLRDRAEIDRAFAAADEFRETQLKGVWLTEKDVNRYKNEGRK